MALRPVYTVPMAALCGPLKRCLAHDEAPLFGVYKAPVCVGFWPCVGVGAIVLPTFLGLCRVGDLEFLGFGLEITAG